MGMLTQSWLAAKVHTVALIRRNPLMHLGGERLTVRVRCLVQEHNTMSPARAWTRTAQSGEERTNYGFCLFQPLVFTLLNHEWWYYEQAQVPIAQTHAVIDWTLELL